MQISADGKQLHAGMRVYIWENIADPPHLLHLTIERVDVHAVRFVQRPGVQIRLADGLDCWTDLRLASEAAFTPLDLEEHEQLEQLRAATAPNVVHGPFDGLYLPAPPAHHPWLMLIRYAGDEADSAVPCCYWWQAARERWVFQPTATDESVAGVRGKKEGAS